MYVAQNGGLDGLRNEQRVEWLRVRTGWFWLLVGLGFPTNTVFPKWELRDYLYWWFWLMHHLISQPLFISIFTRKWWGWYGWTYTKVCILLSLQITWIVAFDSKMNNPNFPRFLYSEISRWIQCQNLFLKNGVVVEKFVGANKHKLFITIVA